MFRLLYTDVDGLSDIGFERLCKALPAQRLERVQAQKNREDKLLSAAAGCLLQTALSDLGIINPEIYCNEHGKPYLKEGGIYFNLSHSGTVAVCAVSSAEVGVDVQQVKPVSQGLIRRICTDGEYAFVTQDGQGVEERFCRLWAVKESVIKCLGRGLSLSPSRVEVKLSDPRRITIDGGVTIDGVTIDGERARLFFKEYSVNGCYIAVCSPVDNFSTEVNKIPI